MPPVVVVMPTAAVYDELLEAELVGGFDFEVGERQHTVTVFPQEGDAGTLRATLAARLTAQALAPLALYTEQGRLDEVFRTLTVEEVTP